MSTTKRPTARIQLRFSVRLDDDVTLAELKHVIDCALGTIERTLEEKASHRIASVSDFDKPDAVRIEMAGWNPYE